MYRHLFTIVVALLITSCGYRSEAQPVSPFIETQSTIYTESEPDSLATKQGTPTSRPTFTRVCRENMLDSMPNATSPQVRMRCGCMYERIKTSGQRITEDLLFSTLDQCEADIVGKKYNPQQLAEFAR